MRDFWRKNKPYLIAAGAIVIALAVVTILISSGVFKKQPEPVVNPDITQIPEPTEEPIETPVPTPSEVIDEPVVYPEPEYDFNVEDVYVYIPGLEKEYTIAWVSDAHILTDFEPAEDIAEDQVETITTRRDLAFVDIYGTPSYKVWPEIIAFLNYNNPDAVIFGGDIMDYCSEANINYVSELLNNNLRGDIPYMYIRADHDYGAWYSNGLYSEVDTMGMHAEKFLDEDSSDLKMLDFNEFKIIGINGSTKDMPEWQYNWFMNRYQSSYDSGQPVIIATHVPYESHIEEVEKELSDLSFQIRNKTYYWGGGDYVPNETTRQFFDKIYAEDTVVKQVLAGHLHASFDGKISEQVSEHIFAPAYSGSIGMVHIMSEESRDSNIDNQTDEMESSEQDTDEEIKEVSDDTMNEGQNNA